MFSFRRDKIGFFITIILLTIVTGTADQHAGPADRGDRAGRLESAPDLSAKWVLGSAWVACIITVLIRLKIFKWQRIAGSKIPTNRTRRRAATSARRSDPRSQQVRKAVHHGQREP